MSIQLAWLNEDRRVLIVTVVDQWRWRDVEPVIEEIHKIEISRTDPFDIIIDMRQSTLYEPNLVDYLREHAPTNMPTSRRLLIIVGADEFTQILLRGVAQMPFGRLLAAHFFDTRDEAIRFATQYTGENRPQDAGAPGQDG